MYYGLHLDVTTLVPIHTCSNSTTQHEFIHALGAYHVQSRSDRDDFVEIKWDNIKEAQKHNFKKQYKALTYSIPYYPLSIMHYEMNTIPLLLTVLSQLLSQKGNSFITCHIPDPTHTSHICRLIPSKQIDLEHLSN